MLFMEEIIRTFLEHMISSFCVTYLEQHLTIYDLVYNIDLLVLSKFMGYER